MSPVRLRRRLIGVLAGLASALLAFATAGPAALASGRPPLPPAVREKHPPLPYRHGTGPVYKFPVRTVVIGGMPGWQITLIAAGAALLAAIAAVVAYRAWAGRRKTVTAGDLPALGGFTQAAAEQVPAGERLGQTAGTHPSDRAVTSPPAQATPR
jgi:hypothetical protein